MRYHVVAFLTLAACSKTRTPDYDWDMPTSGRYNLQLQGRGNSGGGTIAIGERTDDTIGLEIMGVEKGATITIGTEVTKIERTGQTILFDPRPYLGSVAVADLGSEKPVELDVPMSIRFPEAENTFTTKLHLLSIGTKIQTAFDQIEKGPVTFAGDAVSSNGVVVITAKEPPARPELRFVGAPATVREIGWVILVDHPSKPKNCGAYTDGQGKIENVFLAVHKTRVRAFDRRTGKAAGEKAFGGVARCPENVTQVGFVADAHAYTGGDEANAWIEKFASDQLATR